MWKKAAVPYFKVLFRHLPRGIEENREKPVRLVRDPAGRHHDKTNNSEMR
jgi:hypothetical protein